MQDMFERAILDVPDDVAPYAAYADWLQERGDPRGEFMQVQIALEDETKSAAERKALKAREPELLAAHEREWLGELAPHLIDAIQPENDHLRPGELPKPYYRWRRGMLSVVTAPRLTTAFAQALATEPAARLVQELWVHETVVTYLGQQAEGEPPFRVPTPPGAREHWELLELIGSPILRSLRVLQVGGEVPPDDGWCDCHFYAYGLEHAVADMRRVEELHLYCKGFDIDRLFTLPSLTRLRVLRLYHLGERGRREGGPGYEYPLEVLARNPALGSLTHLLFHPHHEESYANPLPSFLPLDQVRHLLVSPHLPNLTHLQLRLSNMGDAGVRELIASGILKRLRWLDLRHGCVTDEGARLLAACPDARHLEHLDLSRNAVRAAGLAMLRAAGVNAVADHPLTDQELADEQYLREGDFE